MFELRILGELKGPYAQNYSLGNFLGFLVLQVQAQRYRKAATTMGQRLRGRILLKIAEISLHACSL